jgi:hypothetical protein
MNFLNKYVSIAIYALILISMLNGCNSCSSKKEVQRLKKEVDSLSVSVHELKNSSYSKTELNTRIAIEGYEISKRMLYDNNTVVRTSKRPDDIIIEYDNKIKELRAKLHE